MCSKEIIAAFIGECKITAEVWDSNHTTPFVLIGGGPQGVILRRIPRPPGHAFIKQIPGIIASVKNLDALFKAPGNASLDFWTGFMKQTHGFRVEMIASHCPRRTAEYGREFV